VGENKLDRLGRHVGREHSLLHNGEIGPNEYAAIEAGYRRLKGERLDQHGHPLRRAAAGDGEAYARLPQAPHGILRPPGQDLVARDKRAVDIGQQQPDLAGVPHP